MNRGNETQKRNSLEKFMKWVEDNSDYTSNFVYHYDTYINATKGLEVTCLKHNEKFRNSLARLKEGRSCKRCYYEKLSKAQFNNRSYSIEELEKRFPTISFDEAEYINAVTPMKLYCKIHKEYFYKDYDHLIRGQGCKKCSNKGVSKAEKDLAEWINYYTPIIENYKPKWLQGMELDIFIPEFNLAIEYNGLYWHSEDFLDKNYHKRKTDLCNANNVNLFHIWEDELRDKTDIILSMLLHKMKLTPFTIGARECTVKVVPLKEANEFLENNHLLGGNRAVTIKGLYYDNELLSVMTMRKDGDYYNLTKFANKTYTNVQGGFSKLLKSFELDRPIISYAEDRWSLGNLYSQNGFNFSHKSPPNYFYVKDGISYNKKLFTKKRLKKLYNCKVDNERDFMYMQGYRRVYESGLSCYIKD